MADYVLHVLAEAADAFLKEGYPEGYAGADKERSPPLQRPQEYCSTHGVAKKKPRSFPEKRSTNKKRRVSPPASSRTTASTSDVDKLVKSSSPSRGKAQLHESTSTSTSDSDGDPCWNAQLLRRWGVSKSRSRRIFSNSGEGTSTNRRLQRGLATGAERAADHQPPPPPAAPPAAPQAGRTWRDVHWRMGGGEVVRIGKKTVHSSDKSKHQSRLLLPQGLEAQVSKHVLLKEKEEIDSDAGLQVDGVRAAVRDDVQVQEESEGDGVQFRLDGLPPPTRGDAPQRERATPPLGLPVAAATTLLRLRPSTP